VSLCPLLLLALAIPEFVKEFSLFFGGVAAL